MLRKVIIIGCVLLTSWGYGQQSQDTVVTRLNKLVPSLVKLHFAGGMGALSAGAGYIWWHNKCQSSLLLGYSPAALSGKNIRTVGIKNSVVPVGIDLGKELIISPYAGATVAWSGYVPLQVLPHLGFSVFKPLATKLKGIDVYAEATTTTRESGYFFKNHTVKWYSILNAGLGTTFYF